MSVYLIGDVSVQDKNAYEEYRVAASKLIGKHRGEYIVRGGNLEVISGDWRPRRLIILAFPDKESVREYLNDSEYIRLNDLRQRALRSDIVMVEGVETL